MASFVLFVALLGFADGQVISGSGNWKYQYEPTLLQFSQQELDENGHGLCKDADGNIFFTFVPKSVGASTQALVRFDPDGVKSVMVGEPGPLGLSNGVPHGLRINYEDGVGYLYHANNDATVIKTTLDGKVVWRSNMTDMWQKNKTFWPYKPTDAIVVPNSDTLLVEDGYGRSWVHKFNKSNGQYLGESFGGKGNTSSDPIKLNTPHGINAVPNSQNLFIITDRSNNRIVQVDADGKYKSSFTTTSPIGMSLPCNADFMATNEDGTNFVVAIPSLGQSYHAILNGSVAIYNYTELTTLMDENVEASAVAVPISVIEVARLIGHLGHQHPHDAIFLENGDLVICCWGGPSDGPDFGPAKGTISYWRRLSN